MGVDNYSPPSIGGERLGVELRDRNLTGIGDELAASYYHTLSGGSDVFDFNYQIPVNAMNGKVQIRFAPNSNKITDPAFKNLGIRANQDVSERSMSRAGVLSMIRYTSKCGIGPL